MTDRQRTILLRRAIANLKKTQNGYVSSGTYWRPAMADLERLERDLDPPPPVVPRLGPVFVGGVSVLLHDLTHATSGLPLFPAFDDAFRQGTTIIAPEDMTVDTKLSSSNPGLAIYATGRSGIRYWFAHLDQRLPLGTKLKRGDVIGKVGPHPGGGGPHVHVGINVEKLLGKGRELDHHTNYTHGAATVGAQLRKLLA